eukprot:2217701-Amphidinium_carterae.1
MTTIPCADKQCSAIACYLNKVVPQRVKVWVIIMLRIVQASPRCASSTWDSTPHHSGITPHLIHHVKECIVGCAILFL